MQFDWVHISQIADDLLMTFDSGSIEFDQFLKENARTWSSNGEAVTYLCVDSEEKSLGTYTRIYAFAAINTTGLLLDNNEKREYLYCAEIRLFAIQKALQKRYVGSGQWSELIFKSILQELYLMSTNIIGFKAIFLNANKFGYELYVDCGFKEITEYLAPEVDEKIEIEECIPLLLPITDESYYDVFV